MAKKSKKTLTTEPELQGVTKADLSALEGFTHDEVALLVANSLRELGGALTPGERSALKEACAILTVHSVE